MLYVYAIVIYGLMHVRNIVNDWGSVICKHFPNHSLLAKIFIRNNIKVSYSCTSKQF